jgi:hypothetical protein
MRKILYKFTDLMCLYVLGSTWSGENTSWDERRKIKRDSKTFSQSLEDSK